MNLLRLARGEWDVLLACDERGRCQVLDLMQELEARGGRGMLALLRDRVPNQGPPFGNSSLCSPVEDGILEFRKGALRVFFFYDEGKVVVCSNGYKKQGQKAPRRHIEAAKACRAAYHDAKARGCLNVCELTDGREE